MSLSRSALAALLVAFVLFGASALALVNAAHVAGTGNAYVRGDITPLSSRVPGVVAEVLVRDNQEVAAGQLLFRIDDRDYRARVDQARAALAARRSELASLERQLGLQRQAVNEAGAGIRAALAEAERTNREFARVAALRTAGWVTRSRSDEAVAAQRRAQAAVDGAQAGAGAAREQLALIESRRPLLLADIEAAKAALDLALIDLDSTRIRAPERGRVAERQVRTGQYIRAGAQLISIVSSRIWVTANFKETQLDGLRSGQGVRVTVDGVPGQVFEGRVQSLSPASGAQFSLLPPDNATGNFTRIVQRVPIRIVLEPGQPRISDLRPGMSARVRLVE